MGPGSVIFGKRSSSGEPAVCIVLASRTINEAFGVEPAPSASLAGEGLREQVREIAAILIGTTGILEVSGLAVPVGEKPGRWAVVCTLHGLSFLGEGGQQPVWAGADVHAPQPKGVIPDYDGWVQPWEFCNPAFNCLEYAQANCGQDPYEPGHANSCSPTPANPGLLECWRAAGCRLDECMWAVCWNNRECECGWYKNKCQDYFNQFGEWPPPNWTPGTPWLECGGAGPQSAACLAVYAAELVICVRSHCVPD
jgi:hypothetical protein